MTKVVDLAREWVGTPFKHQGRIKGQAVDCIGVVVGVARSLGLTVHDVKGYGRIPSNGQLQQGLEKHLMRVPNREMEAGDILLMRFSREPHHVAIYTGKSIIHSYQKIGKCVEHTLNDSWRKRIVATYRIVE